MVVIKHRYEDYDSEYLTIADYLVNFKDVFIMEEVYKRMKEWFVEEGLASGSDKDFPEVFYLEKEGKGGKEIWFRWRFQKKPLANEFWRYDFDVDVHCLTLTKVETIINNKKIKADKGEVEVQVKTNLVMNWAARLKKTAFKSLREVIYRIFLKDTRNRLEQELYDLSYGFREVLNNFFKLPHFEPKKGGLEFWPKKLPE